MSHKRLKLSIAGLVLLLGVGFIAYAGMQKAQVYYLEVDAFLAQTEFHGRPVRLCGTVGQDGLQADPATLTLKFNLLGRQGHVFVLYQGIAPEMFRPGAEVVAEGRLDDMGIFRATQILAKCASKYRPADYPAARETASK